MKRSDEAFDWGKSNENFHDLLVDYGWKFGRKLESGEIPRFQNWIP